MLAFKILLGLLASLALAVDIGLHNGNACSGVVAICERINPNSCCSAGGSIRPSISFKYFPREWNLICSAYRPGGCNGGTLAAEIASNRNTDVCIQGAGLAGGSYRFASRKRGTDGVKLEDADCVKANVLKLEDGTRFDIADLDDDSIDELVS